MDKVTKSEESESPSFPPIGTRVRVVDIKEGEICGFVGSNEICMVKLDNGYRCSVLEPSKLKIIEE